MASPGKEARLPLPPLRGPGPSPPRSSFPESPGLLYRSAFAEECEVLALRARAQARARPTPPRPLRLPSTIEAEALTPLWARSLLGEASLVPGAGAKEGEATQSPGRTFSALQDTFELGGEASRFSLGLQRTFEWELHPLPATSTPLPEVEKEKGGLGSQGGAGGRKRRLPPAGKEAARERGGGAPPRKCLAKKPLPSGVKNALAEAPQEEKKSLPTQPPSQRTRKPLLGPSVSFQGTKLQGGNKPPRTRIPVPPGLERRHTGGPLMTAGQIPRAAPGRASCLQCQRLLQENQLLAKEIQQLKKTLLEKSQGRGTSS